MEETVTLSGRGNEEQSHPQDEHSSIGVADTQGIETLTITNLDNSARRPAQQEHGFRATESRDSAVVEPDHNDYLSSAYASTTEQHSSALETPRSCSDCEDDQRTHQRHPSELSSSMDLSEAGIKGGKKTSKESCENAADPSSSPQSGANKGQSSNQTSCPLTSERKLIAMIKENKY